MRTRTRTTPARPHILEWQYNPIYGLPKITTSYNSGVSVSTESITDDDSPYRGEKRVLHERYAYDERPATLNNTHRYSRNSPGYPDHPDNFLWNTNAMKIGAIHKAVALRSTHGPNASHLPRLADVPLSVQRSMMEQLLPKVNDGLSMVNFILELKDTRRMFDFRTVERMLRAAGMRSYLSKQWKRFRTQPQAFKESLAQSNLNDYLSWQFGWKPFVGDLFAMYKALEGLSRRLKYLEGHQGKVIRRHRSIDLDVPDLPYGALYSGAIGLMPLYYGGFGPWAGGGDLCYLSRFNTWDYRPRYHATLDYYYTFPQGVFGETRRKIRGFLDALGVKFNPQIIWNAIPFSFVVDWIVDVGGWLRQFSTNDLGMEVVILDSSHSVKWNQVGSITCSAPINYRPGPISNTRYEWEVSVEERSYYERDRWRPALELTDGFTLPTFMQFSLGGALAGTRNKRKFRTG